MRGLGRAGAGAIALALAGAAGAAWTGAHAAAADGTPHLTGRWTLNAERSEDARKKFNEAREGERKGKGGIPGLGPIAPGPRGGGPMGGGPMGGRPMGAPPGAKTRGPEEGTRTGELMTEFMDPPKAIAIGQEGGEVSFDTGEETVLRLRPGGRKVKREGGAVELKARWKDDELVVDAEHEDGSRMTTTYRVATDRQTLYVTAKVDATDGEELEVRRIYEPATP